MVDFLYVQFYGLLRVAQDLALEATLKQIDCVGNMLMNLDIWGPNAKVYQRNLVTHQKDVWKTGETEE